jgi:hypothetical protein
MKEIRVTEVKHQWQGSAIVKDAEGLKELDLGVVESCKKLKEKGAKELFTKLPDGTIAVQVKRLSDVTFEYVADAEEFKKIAKLVDTPKEEVSVEANPQTEGEQ